VVHLVKDNARRVVERVVITKQILIKDIEANADKLKSAIERYAKEFLGYGEEWLSFLSRK